MSNVAVIGAGAWGTTLSILLAEKGHSVTLWAFEKDLILGIREYRENKRFLPGFQLPATIEITGEAAEIPPAEFYYFVVPTQFLRVTARTFRGKINSCAVIISASKGIESHTMKLPFEILEEELKSLKVCALSGPNLSHEIAKGLPAAAVAACKDESIAKTVQANLMLERFRIYTNTDVVGVQLGGALKNIIAIAAGIIDGLKLGDNAKSGLMVRGMVEISRLGVALGARTETFAGLSGMGDLITTCGSKLSRNHSVGEQIAGGKKLSTILKGMNEIAEGVTTTSAALELGRKHGIKLPITEEIFNVLYKNKDPYKAITDLMTREAKRE